MNVRIQVPGDLRSWIESDTERSRQPGQLTNGGIASLDLYVQLRWRRSRVHAAADVDRRWSKIKVQLGNRDYIGVQVVADVVVRLDGITDVDTANADIIQFKIATGVHLAVVVPYAGIAAGDCLVLVQLRRVEELLDTGQGHLVQLQASIEGRRQRILVVHWSTSAVELYVLVTLSGKLGSQS